MINVQQLHCDWAKQELNTLADLSVSPHPADSCSTPSPTSWNTCLVPTRPSTKTITRLCHFCKMKSQSTRRSGTRMTLGITSTLTWLRWKRWDIIRNKKIAIVANCFCKSHVASRRDGRGFEPVYDTVINLYHTYAFFLAYICMLQRIYMHFL